MNKYSLVSLPWTHKKPESEVENGGKGDTKVCLAPLSRFKAKEGAEFSLFPGSLLSHCIPLLSPSLSQPRDACPLRWDFTDAGRLDR